MKKKTLLISAGAIALALAGGGGAWYAFKGSPAQATKEQGKDAAKEGDSDPKGGAVPVFLPNELGLAADSELGRVIEAAGSLAAERTATLRSKVAADVRTITVREGESVTQGQVIALLDSAEVTQRLQVAQGALQSAQARAANAKTTRDMQRTLLDQNYISPNAFDNVESVYKAALGDLASASAQVALAQQSLADVSARAPMAGVVAKRFVNPGEKVSFDAPIVQIVDLRSLELQAYVPPEAAGSLRIGQAVEVLVAGFAKPVPGVLTRVMPAVDAQTRQLGVNIKLQGAHSSVKAGLDAVARIRTDMRRVLTVPILTLQSANGEPFVWQTMPKPAPKLKAAGSMPDDGKGKSEKDAKDAKDAKDSAKKDKDGKPAAPKIEGNAIIERRKITLGARDDELGVVEIVSGVTAGARLLIGRYEGLREGQVIQIESTMPAAAKPAGPASAATGAASGMPAASAALPATTASATAATPK